MQDLEGIGAVMLGVAQGIADAGLRVLPMAFLIAQDGRWSIFGLAFKDEPSKLAMYQCISAQAQQMNAAAVYLINDTWIRFSDDPDPENRHEALYAQLVLPDASVMQSTTIPYVRPSDGGPIVWGPSCTTNSSKCDQNLLPPWGEVPRA